MIYQCCKYFFVASLSIVFLFLSADVRACSCGPRPTVLDSYDHADVVVVVRAISVEKVGPELTAPKGHISNGRNYVEGVRSTTMRIEQVFKGDLKVGEQMIFAQGGGADCIWTFNEASIGKEYLFYLSTFKNYRGPWIGFTCGRSRPVNYARDDLLYLQNMRTARGRTRVSGALSFWSKSDLSLADRTIRIVGADKSYEVKTDKDGVYEIYDLPPGKYLIEPEIPFGWRVDSFLIRYSASFAGNGLDKPLTRIPILLESGKHAALDIVFELNNTVEGTLSDLSGNPMNRVCLGLVPADPNVKDAPYLGTCTKEEGRFLIERIPPGAYLLVVNHEGKISSSEPFPAFYYPNVLERDRAAVITIMAGEHLEHLNVRAPSMKPRITVTGRLTFADGKPVANEFVEFKSITHLRNFDREAQTMTDEDGRFTLQILKGLKGPLWGMMETYIGEYENCSKLDAAIKKTGRENAALKTAPIMIDAQKDQFGVELRYPFPGCKKMRE